MFEKYIFAGTNEYKASIKQVSGALQINDVSVTAKTRGQLKQRLRDTLVDVLDVLNELNKEIDTEKESKKTVKNKKLDPHHPVAKLLEEQKDKGKGLS